MFLTNSHPEFSLERESEFWQYYIFMKAGQFGSELAQRTLPFVRNRSLALDLGSGPANDIEYLLDGGFEQIVAVDSNPQAQIAIEGFRTVEYRSKVRFQLTPFQDFQFDPNGYDLVFSHGSLAFHRTEGFIPFMQRLVGAVRPGGIAAFTICDPGHQVIERYPVLASMSRDDIDRLIAGMELLHHELDTNNDPDDMVANHVVIARRR
ncbi:MAG TPA: class I SAM-dependent methyltransferase [Candidatus Paceibacterota bacterium]